jgi:crotonobetainyl-CoA:carnitine CoA-transferase CaiB-like acyl-CoA transferase
MDGSFSGAVAPAGAFKGRDGYVAMFLITDEEWKRLAECMGRPELAVEPRFKTVGDRVKHREELAGILDTWLQEFEQVRDAVALLQDHGLVARPILSLAQALDEEQQIKDREMLVNIEHPTLGTMTCVNTPLCFSNNRAGPEEPPPVAVGEHSEHILREILSLGDGEMKKLRESGVVFGPDGQSTFSK